MKKKIYTIAALALFVAVTSSCSVELRGHDRPWLSTTTTHHTLPVKNS